MTRSARGTVKSEASPVPCRAKTQLRDQARRQEANGSFDPFSVTNSSYRGIRHKPTAPSESHGSVLTRRVPVTGQLHSLATHEHNGGHDE